MYVCRTVLVVVKLKVKTEQTLNIVSILTTIEPVRKTVSKTFFCTISNKIRTILLFFLLLKGYMELLEIKWKVKD